MQSTNAVNFVFSRFTSFSQTQRIQLVTPKLISCYVQLKKSTVRTLRLTWLARSERKQCRVVEVKERTVSRTFMSGENKMKNKLTTRHNTSLSLGEEDELQCIATLNKKGYCKEFGATLMSIKDL